MATVGIEEEFLVVDAVTRRPVGMAEEVMAAGRAEGLAVAGTAGGADGLADAMGGAAEAGGLAAVTGGAVDAVGGKPDAVAGLADAAGGLVGTAGAGQLASTAGIGESLGTELHRELLTSQLEAASGVCNSISELAMLVTRARSTLARLAGERGLLLMSSGTPPLPGIDPLVNDGPRFAQVAATYALVATDYEVCGCHIHVGVADADTAVAVVNHLRPWLPTLLALSVNSPFWHERDTGYASWRMMEQARFPGSGVPPRFADAGAYQREVLRLVECGVLVDRSMSFWLARPSSHLPTVEFRVADAAATVGEAMLQVALSRALVVTALTELEAGREGPETDDQVCAAAVWSAARYGLAGPAVSPLACRTVPAARLVDDLVRWVRPALEEHGDLAMVLRELELLARQGTGAVRQIRAAEKGLDAAVDYLAIGPDGG